MNERIKQLALQAGLLPREIGPVVETRHMKKKEQDLEKFAELIVRECAGIYSKIDNGNSHMGTDNYLEALHKTFRS
jgi:hypothetical protein